MLSILIPTYNYKVLPLAEEVSRQAQDASIDFEVIVLDDASPDTSFHNENEKINLLDNCRYEKLAVNSGRSAARNLLARKAKYSWLLFLDADTYPVNQNFIAGWLPFLNHEKKVVYGGIRYKEQRPPHEELLRWVYGNEREALPPAERKKEPYLTLLTLNFAVAKDVFEKVHFNEKIPNVRYEDVLFSYELSRTGIKVEHIDNPVYHLGLDTGIAFITKTEEALSGLKYLLEQRLLPPDYMKLSETYKHTEKAGLRPIAAFLFRVLKKSFRKNLLSGNPSLFIFDLYRLGYLCSLESHD